MKKIGKIVPKDRMIFRSFVGEAESETKLKYEMALDMGSSVPLVKSLQTGKTFVLSWQGIIELAIKAGVDK